MLIKNPKFIVRPEVEFDHLPNDYEKGGCQEGMAAPQQESDARWRPGLFKGKVVAVTGVSSGIGAATARLLSRQGASIVGFDRNDSSVDLADFYRIDTGGPESIDAVLNAVPTRFDAVCNIAGVPPTSDKHTVLRVNFFGLRHFTERVVDNLVEGGSIVNLSSVAGFAWRDNIAAVQAGMARSFADADAWIAQLDVAGATSYQLSKQLVNAWTIANCNRWKSRGIRMNCVSPGPVETPILDEFIKVLGKRAEEDLALNRPATAEEVARVVAFMCSPDASWINGADVVVDGGAAASALTAMHFA